MWLGKDFILYFSRTYIKHLLDPQIRWHSYLRKSVHKNQVRSPWLSLCQTCCVEQSPRRSPPYYWQWSIQTLYLKTELFSRAYCH